MRYRRSPFLPGPHTLLTDPLFIATGLLAVTFLGLSKGGFAGVGMASTPLLALILPPLQAAAILLPILLVQDAISIWVYRREWSAWNLKVLLPGGLIGVVVGWALAAYVSDSAVRISIGLIGVVFVLYTWFGPKPSELPSQPGVFAGVFWGSLSGFTSTLAQAGAPPFQIYVLPQKLGKMELVGTTAICFGAINAMKVLPYFALGQFSTANLMVSLALLPFAIVMNFVGIWLVKRTPTEVFYRIAYVLVFLISAELLRSGVWDLLFKA